MIDVSDIRYVKFTDCEDPIIDIKVSEVEEIVYPIIVWRKGEDENIYKSAHDRDGKVETGNSKFDLVNKKKRPMTGLEILSIIEKTNNELYTISNLHRSKLDKASFTPAGWMFKFVNFSLLTPEKVDAYLFYFDENGNRASFHIYE